MSSINKPALRFIQSQVEIAPSLIQRPYKVQLSLLGSVSNIYVDNRTYPEAVNMMDVIYRYARVAGREVHYQFETLNCDLILSTEPHVVSHYWEEREIKAKIKSRNILVIIEHPSSPLSLIKP